ncbi:hypothetical protein J6590_041428 [Homalodisca vitripennis]|nr:hypothetical protein J6590_041428 [Homalodisca vitripennis]
MCLPKLSEKYKDTDVYGVGWTPAHWTEVVRNNSPWQYTQDLSSFIFRLYRLYGKSGKMYERGGYLTTLGPKRRQADLTLADLRENYWQDARTRVVFLELTLYNANKNLFSQVTLTVEYMITGSTLLNARITSVQHTIIFIVWLIIFLSYLVFYFCRCFFLINLQGFFGYLSSTSNVLRLLIIITGFLTVVIYILCYFNIRSYLELFQKQGTDSYFDFDDLTFYFLTLKICLSVLLCLAIVRMLVLFRFGKSITMYYYTFVISIQWIVWLMLLLVLCIVAFHLISYFLNTYLIYDVPRIVEKYRKVMQHYNPPEYEYHTAKLFILVKVISLSVFTLLLITLFMYYTKTARY